MSREPEVDIRSFALGIAAMYFNAPAHRLAAVVRSVGHNLYITIKLDGGPILPTDAEKLERAFEALLPGAPAPATKPQPACTECGRTFPRRKVSWGSAGCRVCGRKRRP